MSLFLLTILSLLPFTTPLCSPTLQPPASPPIAIANPLAYCPESTPPFDYLIHYTTVDPMGMDIECEGEGGGCGSVSNMEAFPVTGKGKVEVWLQASSPSSSSNTTSPIISTSVQIYTLPPTFTITPLLSSGYQTSPTGTSLNCTNCITLHRTSTVSSTPSSSYITLSTSCSPTPTNTDTKNMLIHYTTSSTPPTISSPSIPCGSLLNYTLDSPTHGALHTEIRLNFRLFPNPETPEDGNSGYGVYVVNSQTATWQLYISVDSFDSFESDKEAISR
ncbi:hypothetical protein TL16_g02217 [Triparma laevis f. inornata]|uniref:Uncharacterized protein n=1 Tax=Triparma laevis f. inornata TaxID=1714386 RepID=A0A9W6ZRK1_9STRA|nr:hypothetical protein TL16_g02217 [Triparma laevis f. inornata]